MNTTQDWLDAFWGTIEIMAETMADKKKTEAKFRQKVDSVLYDHESYLKRREIWKRVRRKFLGLGLECCDDLTFENADRDSAGNWITHGDLRVYHTEESEIPVVFPGEEAQMAMNFISFFLTSLTQGTNPKQYVKSVLFKQGIRSHADFEALRAKRGDELLISNPWDDN